MPARRSAPRQDDRSGRCQLVDDEHRRPRADEGRDENQRDAGDARTGAERDGHARPQRAAARHAENERIGQWISKESLERRAHHR